MNTLTIKDVPTQVHRALKAQAKAHGRSLNREIVVMLEGSLHAARIDGRAVMNHARAVRESLGVYLTHADLEQFKAEGRR